VILTIPEVRGQKFCVTFKKKGMCFSCGECWQLNLFVNVKIGAIDEEIVSSMSKPEINVYEINQVS
jgi:hypothetical protein